MRIWMSLENSGEKIFYQGCHCISNTWKDIRISILGIGKYTDMTKEILVYLFCRNE